MAKLSPRNWVAHYALKLPLQIWGGQLFWMLNVECWREETPARSSPSLLGSSTDRSTFLVSSCNRRASILRSLQTAPSHTFAIDDSEIMCISLILVMKWSGISSQIQVRGVWSVAQSVLKLGALILVFLSISFPYALFKIPKICNIDFRIGTVILP